MYKENSPTIKKESGMKKDLKEFKFELVILILTLLDILVSFIFYSRTDIKFICLFIIMLLAVIYWSKRLIKEG